MKAHLSRADSHRGWRFFLAVESWQDSCQLFVAKEIEREEVFEEEGTEKINCAKLYVPNYHFYIKHI